MQELQFAGPAALPVILQRWCWSESVALGALTRPCPRLSSAPRLAPTPPLLA